MTVNAFVPNPHVVDRNEELCIFRRLLSGDHPSHMLLIQADPGMGKTALMNEFYAESKNYPRALVDLRPLDYTPQEVLSELADGLETTVKELGSVAIFPVFPRYHEQRERLARPDNINIWDSHPSKVNLTTSWDMRRAQQAALQIITDAFFSDLDTILQQHARVVLIIDTFEKANIEVVRWVTTLLLSRILGRLGIVVVLAGQVMPNLGPGAAIWQLKPLELPDVQEYLNRVELSLSDEEVKVLYSVTKGVPLDLRMGVTKLQFGRMGS